VHNWNVQQQGECGKGHSELSIPAEHPFLEKLESQHCEHIADDDQRIEARASAKSTS